MFSFDRKSRIILMAIVAVILLINTSLNVNTLYSLVGVLIGITFHEFAHAFVAYKLGDDTSKLQGRLSLNPFKHVDPLGLVTLLILGFGWGKPVQIDSRNLTRKMSVSKAEAIISFAGPLMNFLVAIVFSVIMCFFLKVNNLVLLINEGVMWLGGSTNSLLIVVFNILRGIILINLGLGIFNLIPLPPLDGSKILMHFLPTKAQMWFRENEQILYIISLIVVILGFAGTLIGLVRTPIYQFLLEKIGLLFGSVVKII